MSSAEEFRGLPGAELIAQGLRDADAGTDSAAALLIAIGAPRLRRLGLSLPETLPSDGELRLYRRLLSGHSSDAYSEYNALIRELVSFERALERQRASDGAI